MIKAEELKVTGSKKADAKSGASAKQVKVIDPKKDEEDDSDDEDDDSDEEVLIYVRFILPFDINSFFCLSEIMSFDLIHANCLK